MLLCAAVLFAIILLFGFIFGMHGCFFFLFLFWNPAVFSIDDVSSDSVMLRFRGQWNKSVWIISNRKCIVKKKYISALSSV